MHVYIKKETKNSVSKFYQLWQMQNHPQFSQEKTQRDGQKQLYIECNVFIVSYKILIT